MDHALSTELRYLIYSGFLMLALWVPYILAELKMTGVLKALSYPDDRLLPKWGKRLKRAHYNLVENIAPFAIAVVAGELLNVHTAVTTTCATVFFWARLLHPLAQVTRIWGTRTITFGASVTATAVYLGEVLARAG
ncbi:MAG: MAPEG family protein [Hyphomicrobiaceae bacterium]|nr:MAPEG family protein [Hyphomicrobiaceae bacterium]